MYFLDVADFVLFPWFLFHALIIHVYIVMLFSTRHCVFICFVGREIIIKSLDPLRAKKRFIRKKLDHTAVSAIKASSVTL